MDDYEAERVGSDNPAQSVPAAQRVQPSRQRSNGNVKTTAKWSKDAQKTEMPETQNPTLIVVSSLLPLGPLGMGGYAITYLGSVACRVVRQIEFFSDIPVAGDIFFVVGTFIALIMWAFGLTWLCFALASIYKTRPFPFNMGWWGSTFPLGSWL